MMALGVQTLDAFMCHCDHISANHVCSESCHNSVKHVNHSSACGCSGEYFSQAECVFHKNDNSLVILLETRIQKSASNVTVLHSFLISDQQLVAASFQCNINREYRGDDISKYICERDIRSLRAPPVLV